MVLGTRQDRRRRQRRMYWSAFRWLLALALIGAAGVYAYKTGSRLAGRNVAALEGKVGELDQTIEQLQVQAAAQAAAIAAEQARAEEWRRRYEQEVPAGEDKALFDAMRARMAEGVTAERLRFVVERMEARQHCDTPQENRLLLVQTPISGARVQAASFAGGRVSVSLTGVSARDAADNPQAWFDPAQPVTVRVVLPGGGVSAIEGMLPLNRSMLQGNREYRFGVQPSSRGYVQVTVLRCRFP
jgi:ribosomal protein L12E/L44/L45/RPP1/RPP2